MAESGGDWCQANQIVALSVYMTGATSAYTVSELAEETRVPVARIKFYLREQLLPPANLGAKKRAYYGAAHVQRLRLIHALRQVAELGVPAIRELCRLLDEAPASDLGSVVLHVIDALARGEPRASSLSARQLTRAREELSQVLTTHGVRVRANAPALADLARALLGLRSAVGAEVPAQALLPYLDAMRALAEADFAATQHLLTDPAGVALSATFGTVLWEPILILLRRIAHEHVATANLNRASRRPGKR
jgi:DNA-binding transcriptional MerR regulator